MTGAPFIASDVVEVIYRGQSYVRRGFKPHVKRDGKEISLAIWGTTCPQCQRPFECTTPAVAPKFRPTRRCSECRRQSKWRDCFKDPAEPAPLQPGQRPFAPISADDDERMSAR